ncbi:MAG: 4Fe-4S dicluster domain-containing protein [Candidatus Omnitrophota bacterium]
MSSSAEQLHDRKLNPTPQKGKDQRLYIDLDVCASGECKKCVIECSYFYHSPPYKSEGTLCVERFDNNGIISVAELAAYALVCRRCEEPHCVNACPVEALEQQQDKDKMLIRHNMRCISCKSCSHACPYGTIYPENVPYLIHICDFCLDRRGQKDEPLCIKSCPYGALSLKAGDVELDGKTFLVGDNLIVHSTHWQQQKA